MAAEVLEQHGNVDVLINNAGRSIRADDVRQQEPDHLRRRGGAGQAAGLEERKLAAHKVDGGDRRAGVQQHSREMPHVLQLEPGTEALGHGGAAPRDQCQHQIAGDGTAGKIKRRPAGAQALGIGQRVAGLDHLHPVRERRRQRKQRGDDAGVDPIPEDLEGSARAIAGAAFPRAMTKTLDPRSNFHVRRPTRTPPGTARR